MKFYKSLQFLSLILLIAPFPSIVHAQGDVTALPYGGKQFMRDFICEEMVYPENALKKKDEGTVVVSLTVLPDGKTVNYRISESVSPELDQEALRVSKLIMFYPAIKSAKYIIDNVNIPVKFNIKKYKRNCKKHEAEYYKPYSEIMDSSLKIYPTKALDQTPKPVFEKPDMNFGKYIMENLKYPELAYSQNISGTVGLSFVVELSGRVSNIEVTDPLGGGCTEEAIELIRRIMWEPGIKNGMAVRSFMNANIQFNLDNNSQHQYLPNNNNAQM